MIGNADQECQMRASNCQNEWYFSPSQSGASPSPSEFPRCSKPGGSSCRLKEMPKEFGFSCDDPQRTMPAVLMVLTAKEWHKPCCVESQEQLHLQSTTIVGSALWFKICGCEHLAVKSKGNIGTFPCCLHMVAGWHTDNTLSLCLSLAWGAARSDLAVPDAKELQARRPAPQGSTDNWAEGR